VTMDDTVRTRLRETAVATIDERHAWLRELSHAVWECDDLGWQEHRAVAAILGHARQLGDRVSVAEGIGGFETAFSITLDTGQPPFFSRFTPSRSDLTTRA